MTEDEKKLWLEHEIQKMAVFEYHKFIDGCNAEKPLSKVKSEKDAELYWIAMRLGFKRGMNYATKQFLDHNKKLEEEQDGSNN